MTYQEFLTAYRGAGATLSNANDAGRVMGLKRAKNLTMGTWIKKVADEAMRLEAADRARAEREAEELARKAVLAAEAARRGKMEEFVERSKDMNEADKHLGFVLRYFLRDEQMWAEQLAKFTKGLSEHPTYALQWSGASFELAAAFEVAREVRDAFESGVAVSDMVDHLLRMTLRGARNVGNSRSTSATSNLVDDAKTRAYAYAYERLSGKSVW